MVNERTLAVAFAFSSFCGLARSDWPTKGSPAPHIPLPRWRITAKLGRSRSSQRNLAQIRLGGGPNLELSTQFQRDTCCAKQYFVHPRVKCVDFLFRGGLAFAFPLSSKMQDSPTSPSTKVLSIAPSLFTSVCSELSPVLPQDACVACVLKGQKASLPGGLVLVASLPCAA
jgi:hypothetical protein